MPQRIRRTVLSVAAAGVGVTVLAGCNTAPGAAAVVGNQRITDSQVTGYVRDALSDPTFASNVSDPATLARDELSLRIQLALFQAAAAQQGITVTDAQVGSTIQQYETQAGGKQAFESQVAQSGVAPSDVAANLKITLLVDDLARKAGVTDPASTQGQQQAKTVALGVLQVEMKRLGVRVNPRYGTWTPQRFQVTPPALALARPAT